MRLTPSASLIAISLFVAAGCSGGHDSAVQVHVAASSPSTPSTNAAASAAWQNAGQDITANRATAQKALASGESAANVTSFGPYLSQPVDITTAGDYSIVIGPLATADASPRFVNGISLPIDITFASRPDHQMSTFTGSDGKTYGKFTLHVSNVSATYSGLTVWTQ